MLKGGISIVVERDTVLTVQPNSVPRVFDLRAYLPNLLQTMVSFQFPLTQKTYSPAIFHPSNLPLFCFLFQFPSNGKVHAKFLQGANALLIGGMFQFPSNGKVHAKFLQGRKCPAYRRHVSIPFKRESACKGYRCFGFKENSARVSIPFKRESACKVERQELPRLKGKVSIPFKRESACKELNQVFEKEKPTGFNSLQTGKCMQSSALHG